MARHTTSEPGGIDRRQFLKVGAISISFAALGDLYAARAQVPAPGKAGKAKSVIQLWMSGGPSHVDTFDPKPEAGEDYCGPFRKPLATNADGLRIGELLPNLAKQGDKFSILRGMTHGNNGHETATYIVQTGTLPTSDLVYPAIGSVVSLKKGYEAGYKGPLPPYVTVTSPLGRFNEAGFLGTDFQTFSTGGDPNSRDFAVQGLAPPANVSVARVHDRRQLLKDLDTLAADVYGNPIYQTVSSYQQKAYDVVLGDGRKAFDVSSEPDAVRDQYGRNRFGQSCLLARRLVERGVPFVTVNMGGWDTHKDNFAAMRNLLPPLDQGFAALLADLAVRGLLESTIVTWFGEFGRTPKFDTEPPWEGGRNHYGRAFCAAVAGGGFKGGQVVGSTDTRGERVRERPCYPWDLSASMYRLMGIDPLGKLPHPHGCVAYVTPLATGDVPTGGMLNEIM